MSQNDWLRILDPVVMNNLGSVRHVLFDFDGTLSVLRQGWEPVMEAVMIEAICTGKKPSQELIAEVREYIDLSTGTLTILQMQWLANKVISFGMEKNPLSAEAYKRNYLRALMVSVSARLEALENGTACVEDYLIQGSLEFIRGLAEKGVTLYKEFHDFNTTWFFKERHKVHEIFFLLTLKINDVTRRDPFDEAARNDWHPWRKEGMLRD